jgi:NTE family protein
VLLELLRDPRDIEIVGLSGTSGGAMCAALAWRGLVAGGVNAADDASRRLLGFWRELQAKDPIDGFANFWSVWLARMPVTVDMTPYLGEPAAEPRLRELLHRHLQLDALTKDVDARSKPRLLVGATDVLAGERVIFSGESLTVDQLVASAAVPPLFRAVHAGDHVCWDGLFTTNPPVREFMDRKQVKPEEIWVVQINPQRRATEPRSVMEIKDRNNELSGNLSLSQELFFIDKINRLRTEHSQIAEAYAHITVRVVELGLDLDAEALDYPSKLDRDSAHIERLIEAGRERAGWFFEDERSLWPRPRSLPVASVVVSSEQERAQRRSEPAPITEPSRPIPIARPGRPSAGVSRSIEEQARVVAKAVASPEPKPITDATPVSEAVRAAESSVPASEPARPKSAGGRNMNRAERRARKSPSGGSGPASR